MPEKLGGFSLSSSPGLPVPPTELVILVEVFRGPRDAAEGVRGFLPHSPGAEGLGRTEEGGRVAGPPAHWEGTEIGGKGLMRRIGTGGRNVIVPLGADSDSGSLSGSIPYFFWVPKPPCSPEVTTAIPAPGTGALFLPRTQSWELLLPASGDQGVQRAGVFYQGKGGPVRGLEQAKC